MLASQAQAVPRCIDAKRRRGVRSELFQSPTVSTTEFERTVGWTDLLPNEIDFG
jgi:hypothetical protein